MRKRKALVAQRQRLQILVREEARNGESAAKRFAEHQNVRNDAVALAGKIRAGASERGLNFVPDEQHVVAVADIPNGFVKLFGVFNHAAVALNGFHNQRAGAAVHSVFHRVFKEVGALQAAGRIAAGFAHGAAVAVCLGHAHRRVHVADKPVIGMRPAHVHGGEGSSVVAVIEGDELALAGVVADGELYGAFNGVAAVQAVGNLFELARRHFGKAFGKHQLGNGFEAGADMHIVRYLLLHRRDDLGVRKADVHAPGLAGAVEVFLAVHIDNGRTMRFFDEQIKVAANVAAHQRGAPRGHFFRCHSMVHVFLLCSMRDVRKFQCVIVSNTIMLKSSIVNG